MGVFRFLVDHGLPLPLACACIRHQLLCTVRIKTGSCYAEIGRRSLGSLTGSRLAGMAARVPVLHMCCTRASFWRTYGFPTPDGAMTMSTFVDNLFVAGRSCYGVSKILDDAEAFLAREWELRIKPSSRAILAPSNCADVSVTCETKWPITASMKVLGHWIENDGAVDLCFRNTIQSAWKAFYANCIGIKTDQLPLKSKLAMVSRAVTPILRFKWTRWPFTYGRAEQLDALQRRMYGMMMRVQRHIDEPIGTFVRRRGRQTSSIQRSHGSWSKQWALALVGWSDHLGRPRNSATWPAMLAKLRSPLELAERRAAHGRPQTRNASGYVCRRWYESVSIACDWTKT